MDLTFTTPITIPLFEIMLMMMLTTLALLFGRLKLGLLINYCFTIYWGYILNMDIFTDKGGMLLNSFTYMYLGFGFILLLLTILGFYTQGD